MNNKQAFTLIEVMIVMCLIVLLATLGMMQLSFLDSTIERIEVDKLAAVCFFLQQRAIVTHEEQVLVCDVKNNEYRCGSIREVLLERISVERYYGSSKKSDYDLFFKFNNFFMCNEKFKRATSGLERYANGNK